MISDQGDTKHPCSVFQDGDRLQWISMGGPDAIAVSKGERSC